MLALLAVGLAALALAPAPAAADAPDCATVTYDGSGTTDDPYRIATVDQLQCLGNESTATTLSENFSLIDGVDATGTATWNGGAGFRPIFFDGETTFRRFSGTLDGNGHAVRGLTIDRPGEGAGLFRGMGGGTVRNLSFVDANVTGDSTVGVLAGFALADSTVANVSASGTVSGTDDVGGLVGDMSGPVVVRDSLSTVAVTASGRDVGGIAGGAGTFLGAPTVQRSVATGDVAGDRNAGGLVGGASGSPDSTVVVVDSYATGDVSATEDVGGLVGEGFDIDLRRSYAVGRVADATNAGGLVGRGDGTVANAYWDRQATGRTSSAVGGTGLSTAEMTGDAARSNVTGLDFGGTWVTRGPGEYPTLAGVVPVAGDDTYTTREGQRLSVPTPGVLANDDAAGLGSPTVSVVSRPTDGLLRLGPDGSVEYAPDSGFTGTDAFTYRVENAFGITDTATVTVEVRPITPPTAVGDRYTTAEGESLSVSAPGVLADDVDADGDSLSASLVAGPTDGSLSLSADGSFRYTPDAGFTGLDGFRYRIRASGGGTDTATVTVGVNARSTDPSPGPSPDPSPTLDARYDVTVESATREVAAGDRVAVEVAVRNRGGAGPGQAVTLSVDGRVYDGRRVDLRPGERTTLDLAWTPRAADVGTPTVRVASEDDFDGAVVAVTGAEGNDTDGALAATYDVSVAETSSPVAAGEDLTVTAVVENVGDRAGSERVVLSAGGRVRDERTVALSAGERRTVTFEWATAATDGGTYTAVAAGPDGGAPTTVVVTDDERAPADYAGPGGVVDDAGLNAAIADWARDRIDDATLNRVIGAWASGERVATTD